MCKNKFELHAHVTVHLNGLQKHMCLTGCMFTPRARNFKHWESWFLNSSTSKSYLKFMKLIMLSYGHQYKVALYFFCQIWDSFDVIFIFLQRGIINNWEPISQTDYLFEPWVLDQQWIHAMLRLSSKAVALIIKIEKTIYVPPRDPCAVQAGVS